MLKTNRGFWKHLLFSIITLGIYSLIIIHKMAKEANLVDENGKKVGGLLFFIFIGIITLGIYILYWNYRVCEKWADVVRSVGKKPRLTGGAWLLWSIVGAIIIVGPFIALTKQLHSWNDANEVYNQKLQDAANEHLESVEPQEEVSEVQEAPVEELVEEEPVEAAPAEEVQEAPADEPVEEVQEEDAVEAEAEEEESEEDEEPDEEVKAAPEKAKPVRKVYHISYRKEEGTWQVKLGGKKVLKLFKTQEEGIKYAKALAESQDGSIVIHMKDGSIRKQKY
ncbi:MAG: DUF4234 domain-containing protein [Gammaproteobacteria bacterium]|nr:DUF4234 domain-containing protein [Gammaproteobacteria bacterium]